MEHEPQHQQLLPGRHAQSDGVPEPRSGGPPPGRDEISAASEALHLLHCRDVGGT